METSGILFFASFTTRIIARKPKFRKEIKMNEIIKTFVGIGGALVGGIFIGKRFRSIIALVKRNLLWTVSICIMQVYKKAMKNVKRISVQEGINGTKSEVNLKSMTPWKHGVIFLPRKIYKLYYRR